MTAEDAGLLTAIDVSVAVDEQVLLPPTSLSLEPGRTLAIRGPNGAGKTTLLRVLAGLLPTTSGRVRFGGDPLHVRRRAHRAAIAAMIGAPPLARDLTLIEQLRFVRATWGDDTATGEDAAGVAIPSVTAFVTGADPRTIALAATLGAVLVAVRAYDATKGALPIELMMPVPTPAGDASAIVVWAWQADALLWTGVLSFWLSRSSTAGPVTLLWAVPAAVLLAALTARRLRRAAS